MIYKKVEDVFEEEYKVEASAKTEERKEERRMKKKRNMRRRRKIKRRKTKMKTRVLMGSKTKVCKTHNYHLLALLTLLSHL